MKKFLTDKPSNKLFISKDSSPSLSRQGAGGARSPCTVVNSTSDMENGEKEFVQELCSGLQIKQFLMR